MVVVVVLVVVVVGFINSHEHGDAGGIIFIDFGENYKNRFFIKTVFWI